jgi:hypothetical protein
MNFSNPAVLTGKPSSVTTLEAQKASFSASLFSFRFPYFIPLVIHLDIRHNRVNLFGC